VAFFGRQEELQILQELTANQLAVATITGRRRIGKSRLVAEHARRSRRHLIKIEGRDTPQGGNGSQLAAFAADLSRDAGVPGFSFENWNAAFNALGALSKAKQWIILLDEITWLARHSEECLAELKVFIDRHVNGSSNQLILCGSVSQWIEQHVNQSDLFVGRISKKIDLKPLTLAESAQFWSGRDLAPREILTALCVTGGVPRYLEEIDVRESAEWNIRKLCFDPAGYMASELPNLIKSSFLNAARESSLERYLKILEALAGHGKTLAEIAGATGIHNNEALSNSLTALALSGIVSENPSWSLKTTSLQKRNVRYRVEDPYTRFYIKYIRPQLVEINKGLYRNITLRQLPGWETVRGLQFEALVGQSMVPAILDRLQLRGVPVQRFGPYFQSKTARHPAVQIDYLLQTSDTLYVCETKFTKTIEASVIDEVKEKIKRLGVPKNMTLRKVLIYSGEPELALKESIFFDREICVDALLGQESE
jgi:uncharacterized protein